MKKERGCRDVEKHVIKIVEEKGTFSLPGEIKDHLLRCAPCQRLVNDFAKLWKGLEPPPEVQPSPSFLSRILEKIEETEIRKKRFKPAWGSLRPAFKAVPVVILAAIGVLVGIYLGSPPSSRPLPTSSQKTDEATTRQYMQQYFNSLEELPQSSLAEAYATFTLQKEEKQP